MFTHTHTAVTRQCNLLLSKEWWCAAKKVTVLHQIGSVSDSAMGETYAPCICSAVVWNTLPLHYVLTVTCNQRTVGGQIDFSLNFVSALANWVSCVSVFASYLQITVTKLWFWCGFFLLQWDWFCNICFVMCNSEIMQHMQHWVI